MTEAPTEFGRFVTTIYRRAVVARLAEHAGAAAVWVAAGAAAGAAAEWAWPGAAAVVEGIVWTSGAGVLLMTWRNPTRTGTLRQIDEQLGWAELAISAEAVQADARSDAAVREALLQAANAASRATSPSDVCVRRWGGRRWGGVLSVLGIALVVARLVPTGPRPVERAAASADVFADAPLPTPQSRATASLPESETGPRSSASPGEENGRSMIESDAVRTINAVGAATGVGASSNGAGGGQARGAEPVPLLDGNGARIGAVGQTAGTRGLWPGSGPAARTSDAGVAGAGGGAGTVSGSPHPNLWQTTVGAAPARDSGGAVASERAVPARDRDLVRAFHDAAQSTGD